MNVIEETTVAPDIGIVAIRSVEPVDTYKLKIGFTDGTERVVDFEPFLRSARHPAIRAYLEPARFKGFTVEDGFLHWNDFDLVFPLADLYAGQIR
jgi:hypothetical protein